MGARLLLDELGHAIGQGIRIKRGYPTLSRRRR